MRQLSSLSVTLSRNNVVLPLPLLLLWMPPVPRPTLAVEAEVVVPDALSLPLPFASRCHWLNVMCRLSLPLLLLLFPLSEPRVVVYDALPPTETAVQEAESAALPLPLRLSHRYCI